MWWNLRLVSHLECDVSNPALGHLMNCAVFAPTPMRPIWRLRWLSLLRQASFFPWENRRAVLKQNLSCRFLRKVRPVVEQSYQTFLAVINEGDICSWIRTHNSEKNFFIRSNRWQWLCALLHCCFIWRIPERFTAFIQIRWHAHCINEELRQFHSFWTPITSSKKHFWSFINLTSKKTLLSFRFLISQSVFCTVYNKWFLLITLASDCVTTVLFFEIKIVDLAMFLASLVFH